MISLSKYLISTILEGTNRTILFSTRSGNVCTVSNKMFDQLKENNFDDIPSDIMIKLVENEMIIDHNTNELGDIIAQNKTFTDASQTLYEVIQPTAMCQLGCGYCGQHHTKDHLKDGTIDKILKRIEEKLARRSYSHLSIGWFGSEPLMGLKQIRLMSRELLSLAKKYNCTYGSGVVTNGLSLKVPIFLELVNEHKVKTIEITLDGISEYHDKRRHTKEGLRTFDLILSNLLKITNLPNYKNIECRISIRCNVDSTNYAGVKPLVHLLAQHKLQSKISHFYVAPIHSWGNDAHLQSLEKEEFAKLEIEWLLELLNYGFNPNLLPVRNKQVCLSVSKVSEVYDAFGNVYDCTETPLVDSYVGTNYVLGNLMKSETISSNRPLIGFNEEILAGEYPCTKCPMLPTCGGGCPKSWKEGIIACPSTKANIKERLMIHYLIQKQGIQGLNKITQEANQMKV